MKKQYTFTIDEELYEEFRKYSKEKAINKSLYLENCIKDYIEKNKKKDDTDKRN